MKKKAIASSFALLAFTVVSAQTYQLPNVGFENWQDAKGIIHTEDNSRTSQPGKTPQSWFSSNIKYPTGSFELVQEKNENGIHYTNISNKKTSQAPTSLLPVYIPFVGTLSLGQAWYVQRGNGSSTDISWTGYNKSTNLKYAQNGTFGGLSFIGRPDALAGNFKSDTRNNNENAHIVAYLWNGSFSGKIPQEIKSKEIKSWRAFENLDRAIWSEIDPSIVTSETVQSITKSEGAEVVAYCDKTFDSTFGWTPVEIPLTYKSKAAPSMTNVIIAAGNPWDSRKSVEDNNICADNIRYVYYSRLSSASIDGYAFDFDANTFDYVITVDDAENLTLPTGVNYEILSNEALTADKEATVSSDNDTKTIAIRVTNKQSQLSADATDVDGQLEHTYNFYFREAPQAFEGFYFTNVDGSDIYSGEATTFTLAQENADYRNYTLTVNDVKVAQAATRAAGDPVNITVSGLTKTEVNGKVVYTGTDDNAKVGDETKQVSTVATFDGEDFEVKFSFTNEDGTVTNVVATPEPATSGVSEINGATATVSATDGAIRISNYNGAAAIYTTDGRLATNAEIHGAADIHVAAGLYIVRTGNKATKVIVK